MFLIHQSIENDTRRIIYGLQRLVERLIIPNHGRNMLDGPPIDVLCSGGSADCRQSFSGRIRYHVQMEERALAHPFPRFLYPAFHCHDCCPRCRSNVSSIVALLTNVDNTPCFRKHTKQCLLSEICSTSQPERMKFSRVHKFVCSKVVPHLPTDVPMSDAWNIRVEYPVFAETFCSNPRLFAPVEKRSTGLFQNC